MGMGMYGRYLTAWTSREKEGRIGGIQGGSKLAIEQI